MFCNYSGLKFNFKMFSQGKFVEILRTTHDSTKRLVPVIHEFPSWKEAFRFYNFSVFILLTENNYTTNIIT